MVRISIGDVRRRLHQVEIRFAFEPLLDDFHVQQAQESAAEAEAQRIARFGLEFEARVVDAELGERVAQLFEVLSVRRIQPAIHHALRHAGSRAAARPALSPGTVTVSPMWTWSSALMLQIR